MGTEGGAWPETGPPSNPAGPRIVCGSSLRRGRSPSISPGTSSTHTTPGKPERSTLKLSIWRSREISEPFPWIRLRASLQCVRKCSSVWYKKTMQTHTLLLLAQHANPLPYCCKSVAAWSWGFEPAGTYLTRVLGLVLVDQVHQEEPVQEEATGQTSLCRTQGIPDSVLGAHR